MANKMTERDFYNLIATTMSDNTEVVNFCHHKIELLDKAKSRKGESKVAKANAEVGAKVYDLLVAKGERMTFAEIRSAISEIADYSSQKMSAIVKPYIENGTIVKKVDKKVTYFEAVSVEEQKIIEEWGE